MILFCPELGQGRISFHWTTEALKYCKIFPAPRPTYRTLLRYAAPY